MAGARHPVAAGAGVVGVAPGAVGFPVEVPLGVRVTDPPLGEAATAAAMAALSRVWASPYLVKSPALRAASPSLSAFWASVGAWVSAEGLPVPGW